MDENKIKELKSLFNTDIYKLDEDELRENFVKVSEIVGKDAEEISNLRTAVQKELQDIRKNKNIDTDKDKDVKKDEDTSANSLENEVKELKEQLSNLLSAKRSEEIKSTVIKQLTDRYPALEENETIVFNLLKDVEEVDTKSVDDIAEILREKGMAIGEKLDENPGSLETSPESELSQHKLRDTKQYWTNLEKGDPEKYQKEVAEHYNQFIDATGAIKTDGFEKTDSK